MTDEEATLSVFFGFPVEKLKGNGSLIQGILCHEQFQSI